MDPACRPISIEGAFAGVEQDRNERQLRYRRLPARIKGCGHVVMGRPRPTVWCDAYSKPIWLACHRLLREQRLWCRYPRRERRGSKSRRYRCQRIATDSLGFDRFNNDYQSSVQSKPPFVLPHGEVSSLAFVNLSTSSTVGRTPPQNAYVQGQNHCGVLDICTLLQLQDCQTDVLHNRNSPIICCRWWLGYAIRGILMCKGRGRIQRER